MVGRGSFGSGWRWSHTHSRLEQQTVCPVIELGLGLGLLKDNDEDITIFQGNRYPHTHTDQLGCHRSLNPMIWRGAIMQESGQPDEAG